MTRAQVINRPLFEAMNALEIDVLDNRSAVLLAAGFIDRLLDSLRGGGGVSDADIEAARFALDIAAQRANGLAAALAQNIERSREAG